MTPVLAAVAIAWLAVTLLILAASAAHRRANPAGSVHAHLLLLAAAWPLVLGLGVLLAVAGVGASFAKAAR